ncbi:MAG: hypothetical protein QOC68_4509 [Solirubrobacteraceae bacterium]|jgi:hypothetical protein|uniref:DUF5313 family protein n=1 Tax=Pseudonocardia sp. TaxID=60912 RepID=UPI002632C3E7|nr:DUF5313 family protein [Pseudonocardia sp.]MCU1628298.1 hypothetical protein [Pseudonocardia sp.]MDT7699766.1 hypothetical protein [Pseudonocardiales bacterium]MEA2136599.1 hypothetical protein [Solirubrobacteraceae bacterium]
MRSAPSTHSPDSHGITDGSPRRPGPLRWLWYAAGGALPSAYREWVRYDVTCRTWPLRHLLRLLAQLVPVAVVLLVLIPGPMWVRVMAVASGSLVGLAYSFVFLYEATEHRACKAGYPHGTAARVRAESRAARRSRS